MMRVVMLGEISPSQLEELETRKPEFKHPATWIKNLSEALGAKQGLELHVISETNEINDHKTIYYKGVKYHFIKRPNQFRTLTLFQFDRYRIQNKIKEIKPDLVHSQGTDEYGYAAISRRWPAVITVHGIRALEAKWLSKSWLSRWTLLKYIELYCFKKAEYIISINPYVDKVIKNKTKAVIFPIENAINDDFYQLKSTDKINRLIFIGTIEPRKSPLLLMKAFIKAKIQYPDLHLTIIGPYDSGFPDYQDEIQKYVNQQGEKSGIQLMGWRQPEEVRREISKASILVLPSRQETAPMVIAEAMAAGLMIIATRAGGIEYMVGNEKEGYLVDIDDEKSLFEAIINSQKHPEKTKIMRANAKKAASKYNSHLVADKTYSVYKKIIYSSKNK